VRRVQVMLGRDNTADMFETGLARIVAGVGEISYN